MAMYIVVETTALMWYIGQNAESIRDRINEEKLTVSEVQADGDELEWIRENFTNIPMHKTNRVQSWFGDMAQFITSCLPITTQAAKTTLKANKETPQELTERFETSRKFIREFLTPAFRAKFDGEYGPDIHLTIGHVIYRGLNGKYYTYQGKELIELEDRVELTDSPSDFEIVSKFKS